MLKNQIHLRNPSELLDPFNPLRISIENLLTVHQLILNILKGSCFAISNIQWFLEQKFQVKTDVVLHGFKSPEFLQLSSEVQILPVGQFEQNSPEKLFQMISVRFLDRIFLLFFLELYDVISLLHWKEVDIGDLLISLRGIGSLLGVLFFSWAFG